MESVELTILMPCLNEAETLSLCIEKAKSFLAHHGISGEVLIADNGSVDGSEKIAARLEARVVQVKERGYGAALIHGIEAAKGRYVIMGDADDSYDFSQLMPFITKLREGYDLVMGNRFRGGIKKGAMPFLNRYLGNPILSLIGRLFFKSSIGDFHCGLRGFKRESMRLLKLEASGMEFASEMVVKSTLSRLKITEVPTVLSPDGRSRKPHLRPWRDGWRHLKLLLLMSPRWLFLYPGMGLATLGLVLMFFLALSPLKLGKFVLDIHTMLFSSLFVIVGLQIIFFFLFARLLAVYKMNWMNEDHGKMVKFLKSITLEKGIMIGALLIAIGFIGSIDSFLYWMHHSFGGLIPSERMRVLIPSFTAIVAGIQILFSSFFMSVLMLYYKKSS